MYTRNQGSSRAPLPQKLSMDAAYSGPVSEAAASTGGIPILIPQDYHGEFLRDRRTPTPMVSESPDTAAAETNPATEVCMAADSTIPAVFGEETQESEKANGSGRHDGSLLGGLYDLLLGENSSEEETLLLLGIVLLLLWGHLDRGDLFDRSTWESEDLALILIGYLLLS